MKTEDGSSTFFCGGDSELSCKGSHYAHDPEKGDAPSLVVVGGDCKAIFEDCVIDGPRAITLLGYGSKLVLRRCRVRGQVVVGSLLELEGTTLTDAPIVFGKGRIVHR
jgi:hypothetical protein